MDTQAGITEARASTGDQECAPHLRGTDCWYQPSASGSGERAGGDGRAEDEEAEQQEDGGCGREWWVAWGSLEP